MPALPVSFSEFISLVAYLGSPLFIAGSAWVVWRLRRPDPIRLGWMPALSTGLASMLLSVLLASALWLLLGEFGVQVPERFFMLFNVLLLPAGIAVLVFAPLSCHVARRITANP
jgi:hypothetical protein